MIHSFLQPAIGAFIMTAGLLKAVKPVRTARLTPEYSTVPERFEKLSVWLTYPAIALEVVLGALVVLDVMTFAALALTLAMLSFYTFVLMVELARGNRLDDCGCYGIIEKPLNEYRVAENILLIAALLYLVI